MNAAPGYAAYFRCNKGNLLSRGRVQRRGPPLPGGQATLRFQLSFNHHPMTQPPPKPSSRSAGSHGTREDEKKQHSKRESPRNWGVLLVAVQTETGLRSPPLLMTSQRPLARPMQVLQSGTVYCRFCMPLQSRLRGARPAETGLPVVPQWQLQVRPQVCVGAHSSRRADEYG